MKTSNKKNYYHSFLKIDLHLKYELNNLCLQIVTNFT